MLMYLKTHRSEVGLYLLQYYGWSVVAITLFTVVGRSHNGS